MPSGARTRERLDNIKLEIQATDRRSRSKPTKARTGTRKNDNVVETAFDIQVPAATTLDLDISRASSIVRGTTGEIDAERSAATSISMSRAPAAPD